MNTLLQDLRFAVRLHASRPGFAAVAVLSLALGIGLNTAIFSVVDGVLLRPTPVEGFDRLMMVWQTDRDSGTTREPASFPDFEDFRARSRTFETMAALSATERVFTPVGGDPTRLAALFVSHEFLPMVGVQPLAGRVFTADETRPGGGDAVLIGESLWAREFQRRPEAVGATIRIDEVPRTVIGVVPDTSDFGVLQILTSAAYSRSFADRGARTEVDVWLPMQSSEETSPRSTHPLFVLGRLAPGASRDAAQAELTGIAADLERTYPDDNRARGAHVEALSDVVFGPVRPALLVLSVAVGLVLLVACVNVANLLLARGVARAREVAIRTALGSGTSRLARQFVVETLALTLVAGAVGVAVAYGALAALLAQAPAHVPRVAAVGIDVRVLALTAGVSLLVGLVFGLVPTWQARRVDPATTLKGEAHAVSEGRATGRLRAGLVVAELALAVILVTGAGLLIRSFWQLQQVDPGFQPAGVLKAEFQLPRARYPVDFSVFPNLKEHHAFNAAVLERVASLPGVEASAIAGNHPLDPGFTNSFTVVGREAEAADWPEISVRRVTPGYFETVGLGLVRGRLLSDADETLGPPVSILNETAARRFFGETDPLGHQIQFWGARRTVVGIVRDEKFHGLTEAPPLGLYIPLAQAPSINGAGVLLVRAAGDPLTQASAVRSILREVDPGLAAFGIEPLDETLSRSMGERRFTMLLLGLFGVMALTLAALGVHGVLSYAVARQRQEIGIRMALGAAPGRVRRLVVGRGLVLTGLGVAAGLAGALGLTRLMRSLLFGVEPADPLTFASVAGLLVVVAFAASYAPARRATRIDPSIAMRAET